MWMKIVKAIIFVSLLCCPIVIFFPYLDFHGGSPSTLYMTANTADVHPPYRADQKEAIGPL